jgi:hypothetical protein
MSLQNDEKIQDAFKKFVENIAGILFEYATFVWENPNQDIPANISEGLLPVIKNECTGWYTGLLKHQEKTHPNSTPETDEDEPKYFLEEYDGEDIKMEPPSKMQKLR